ncbi:MAG: hypothetical protein HYW48_04110 [Deltaproteobacteria bacterium]|nr:hypothetical protein [Deltaproteobacteria bacterium]
MLNRGILVALWVVCAGKVYSMEDMNPFMSRTALMGRSPRTFEPGSGGGNPFDDDSGPFVGGQAGGMYGMGGGGAYSSPMYGGFNMYGGGQLFRQSNPGALRFSYPFYDPSQLSEQERKALAEREMERLLNPRTPRDHAVAAILGKGTLRSVKLNGHHWQIQPAQISVVGNRVLFEGSLFHTGWFSAWHELTYEVMFIEGQAMIQMQISDQINYLSLVLRPLLFVAKIFIEYKFLGDFKYAKLEQDRERVSRQWEERLAKTDPAVSEHDRMATMRDLELGGFDKMLKFQKRKEYVDVGMQVLNAGVDSYQRLNNERFTKVPDWEKQAYTLANHLISAAWERVFLMGLAYEDLEGLFENPAKKPTVDFKRAFHPKGPMKAQGGFSQTSSPPAPTYRTNLPARTQDPMMFEETD